MDRVWTAVELAKHALEADPTRVSKLGRCYETEPATVLRAGTGVPPNNGSTTVGVISQLIPIRTKKRNSSEMTGTGTTAFIATAIGFSSTMAFPVVLGVTQTRTPVPSSDFRQTDSRAHDKIYIFFLSLEGHFLNSIFLLFPLKQ
ncbi:predicted protein [Arabidopsis lyrata subsp. lyrata]|uniref:Predicted protein n=2 Tax=Arabidopsis lyrata subsp. lyrata TaxID=81972 RepID=D7LP55_ARALL|nr:predicted protein [Arabidopsis lyrata subsp. lyrata]